MADEVGIRPRTQKRPARSETLKVRLTKEEHAELKRKADEAGIRMSALVRESVYAARVRYRDAATVKADRDRLAMLNCIIAKLNMIARWANRYRRAVEAVEVISHLIAIERSVLRNDS